MISSAHFLKGYLAPQLSLRSLRILRACASTLIFFLAGLMFFSTSAFALAANCNSPTAGSAFVPGDSSCAGPTSAQASILAVVVNNPPVLYADPVNRRTAGNMALDIPLSELAYDPEGDRLSAFIEGGPSNGVAEVITSTDRTFIRYMPRPEFTGQDNFYYVVTDSKQAYAGGNLNVEVGTANRKPSATPVSASTLPDQATVIDLSLKVSDPDKDLLTLTIVQPPVHGEALVEDSRRHAIRYIPQPGFSGDDQFDYEVSDGYGGTATATVTLKISAVSPAAQTINIKVLGGDVQLARLNTNSTLSVQVTDETGQNLAGVNINWSATEPSGAQPSIAATDPATDSAGISRAVLTTSNMPTRYTVTASVVFLAATNNSEVTFTVATGLHALTRPDTPERAMADVLDSMCPRLQASSNSLTEPQQALLARCNEIMNAATEGNDGQIITALRSLAPDEVAAQGRMGNSFAQQQLGNIGSRLAALRSGASGLGLSGLSFNIKGRIVPGAVLVQALDAEARTAASVDLPQAVPRWGGFISGTIGGGDKGHTASEEGFNFHTRGVTAGADYRYSSTTVFGSALGYARSDVNLDANGGGLDASGLSLSLYGTYYRTQSLYLDAVMNYATNNYDQTRNIDYTVGSTHIQKTARSDTGGKLLTLSVGGGYEFTAQSGASAEVSLRLHRIASTIDSYTETGANELNLALNDQYIQVFSSTLGTRGSWPMSLKWGVLIPQVDVSWEHELSGGAHKIKGSFVNDQFATAFAFKTDDPDRNYFQVGLGVSAIIPGGKTAFLQYQTTLGRDHYRDYTVALGGRVELR